MIRELAKNEAIRVSGGVPIGIPISDYPTIPYGQELIGWQFEVTGYGMPVRIDYGFFGNEYHYYEPIIDIRPIFQPIGYVDTVVYL